MTAAGDPKQGHGPTKGNGSPQKDNGQAHRGPRGPLGFSGLGKIPVKLFSGRVWGGIGPPKGFLGTIQTIPLAKNLGKPRGDTNPSTKLFFSAPLFGPRRGPWAFLGQEVGSGLQKWVPEPKISKLRVEKPCRTHWLFPQTEPHVASYGQIRFGDGPPKNRECPLPLGRLLCPRGNPKAPGATPKPLGQPQSALGKP